MKVKTLQILPAVLFVSFSTLSQASDYRDTTSNQSLILAQADPHAGHHGHMGGKANKASAKGTIHSIDLESRNINLTHDPIPALGWPQMRMDLATTKRVKLEKLKAGDVVEFEVKKGRDNMFRITKIKPVE